MLERDPNFTDLTILDSALADAAYSPAEVALFQQVLDDDAADLHCMYL